MSSILWLPEQIGDALGRVTAGLPSLDPQRRASTLANERKREKLKAAEQDGLRKKEQAVAADGGRPRTVLEACLGNALTGEQVTKRLRSLNSNLIFENHPTMRDRICVSIHDPKMPEKKRFICGMERGYAPEFSVLDEETGSEKKRGYWTVIYKLIKERLITKAGAERVFGVPHSKNWQSLTT
jgi:hypothetical protein